MHTVYYARPTPTPVHRTSGGNWFSALFGHHHRRVTPTPVPTATPLAHRHHKLPGAESATTPGGEATPTPEAPAPESTPTPKPGGMTEPVPFVPPPEKTEAPDANQTPVIETQSPAEEEADERSRFQAAKTKALTDPHIQDLQSAADSATGDDAIAAGKRYYRALYDKMRDIDPSIKDRIDRTEAATLRRVEQENTQ